MTKPPLVSVIVPVSDSEQYLSRCILSILNQTYTNLEIILINDGSKDKSPQICDNFAALDSRIKVVHKEFGGISSARNTGLDLMTGDYVSFVDSDDFIGKNFINNLMMMCKRYQCDIASCSLQKDDGNDFSPVAKQGKTEVFQKIEAFMHRKINSQINGRVYKSSLFLEKRFCVSEPIKWKDAAIIDRLFYQSDKVAFTERKLYYCYKHRECVLEKENYLVIEDLLEILKDRILFFSDKEEALQELSWEDYCIKLLNIYQRVQGDEIHPEHKDELLYLYQNAYTRVMRNSITPVPDKLLLTMFHTAPDLCIWLMKLFKDCAWMERYECL